MITTGFVKTLTKGQIGTAILDCWNLSELARKLGITYNISTKARKDLRSKMDELGIDYSHLKITRRPKRTKYRHIDKICPICGNVFKTKKDHPREKTTCSHSCANTFFRSGRNNPNYKDGSSVQYRIIALQHYPMECNRCSYSDYPQVLQIHHLDRDRSNNDPENLEVLCPTCHEIEHYTNKDGRYSSTNSNVSITPLVA